MVGRPGVTVPAGSKSASAKTRAGATPGTDTALPAELEPQPAQTASVAAANSAGSTRPKGRTVIEARPRAPA